MAHHSAALLIDLYELTMAQAYLDEGLDETAVFSLFVRRLPPRRNYLLACGLEEVLTFLESLHFDDAAVHYLRSLNMFSEIFLAYLERLRFTGDVYAVAEGTPVFATEPILEVVAPLIEAQLVESFVMNQVHLQTVMASKAARIVESAKGRPVVDFGLRRMHGADAALKAARAFYIAGVDATSNVATGQTYGVPLSGTMAHSYVQAHEDELSAFRAFVQRYPGAVLVVDTYDTLAGIRHVIDLFKQLGAQFSVDAIRLDSGDLRAFSLQARHLLDEAGLQSVRIFASGGLDEDVIAALVAAGAPIDGFGVGTEMGVSADAPSLDMAYKLVAYAGRGRIKLSTDKSVLPGRKQILRIERDGTAARDLMARHDEPGSGRPLLRQVMSSGQRITGCRMSLNGARRQARDEMARLPASIRAIRRADPPYRVDVSKRLELDAEALRRLYQ